jgi:Leucine-rich repeat (LRR) protein
MKMKKYFTLLIALVAMAMSAQAQVAINSTNFPDANFRAWLLDAKNISGYGADGQLTTAEIESIKEMFITGLEISDLTGIGYFTALEVLECGYNPITTLDLSNNTKLASILISSSPLTSLKTPESLKELHCGYQDLSFIDFSKFKKLVMLDILQQKYVKTGVGKM